MNSERKGGNMIPDLLEEQEEFEVTEPKQRFLGEISNYTQPEVQQKPSNMPKVALIVVLVAVLVFTTYRYWLPSRSQDGKLVVTNLSVSAILYAEDDPSAVINTQIVHEGDMIGSTRVAKIYPSKVEFEQGGKSWTQTTE